MASDAPRLPSRPMPRLAIDQINEIAELSAAYLSPEAADFSEEDLLLNLQRLHQLSVQKPSKISKKDSKRILKMVLSAFGRHIRRSGSGDFSASSEIRPQRVFRTKLYHHDPVMSGGGGGAFKLRLEMLKRLLGKGGISKMAFNTKFPSEESEKEAVKDSTYGERVHCDKGVMWKKDFHEYLRTGNSEDFALRHLNFGFPNPTPLYRKVSEDFGIQSVNYVLAMPALEKKRVGFEVTEKKLFKTVTRTDYREELVESDKVLVAFHILTDRKDTFGRGGIYWHLSIECTKDAAEEILASAPKTHRELYDFFVETVPGFSKIEGKNYEKYTESLKGTDFKRKEFSSIADMNKLYNISSF